MIPLMHLSYGLAEWREFFTPRPRFQRHFEPQSALVRATGLPSSREVVQA